jgi:predicted Zn-dependent protease
LGGPDRFYRSNEADWEKDGIEYMADSLFFNLGRKMGPKLRKARWMWESMTGTEADAVRLEHGVGLDLAHEAKKMLQIDADAQTRQALDDTGYPLVTCVANKLRSFHFEAFQSDEPNAFALPGGFIFVSRSIIELCRWDKSEVAFILAHEMGHVIRGHAIERIVASSAVSAVSRTAPVRGVLGGWLRSVGVQFLQTAYSRDQELEADRLGVRLMIAAGYEPQASMRLLARLAELKQSSDPLNLGEYFSTHPNADVRIRSIRHYLRHHSSRQG